MKKSSFMLVCFAAFWISSCAIQDIPPLWKDRNLSGTTIDKITVMPTLDARIDKKDKLENLNAWVTEQFSWGLPKKGYKFTFITDKSLINGFSEETLSDADSTWVATLKPEGARWILIPVLNDLQSTLTFGATANCEMSAYLFDRKASKLVWRHKSTQRTGQGGLSGMVLKGTMKPEVVKLCVTNFVAALPSLKNPTIK